MTALERKLVAKMLTLASAEFSNHGCNDFHLLRDGGLTALEAAEVREALVRDGAVESVFGDCTQDWLLMAWLAERVLV